MKYAATHPQHATTAELLATLAAVALELTHRAALRTLKALRTAANWLTTSHNFAPFPEGEDEKVILKGWQYVCTAAALSLAAVVLSFMNF